MKLASIWRHPIKAIGREEMASATLEAGRTLPLDRRWAVTHGKTRDTGPGWAKKANFLRGVSGPQLMAVTARTHGQTITLSHPEQADLTLNPDTDADTLLPWLDPLWPQDLPRPTGIATCATGFTDVPDPWISIHNLASHRAVEGRLGTQLSIHRWRGNLWLDGMDLWHEFDLVGRALRIGEATLHVHERITRCRATEANPETGERDADTLRALRNWDHQDFGIYAEVVEGGPIAPGAPVTLL
ncbi:MAG: MOSC domain-containing protein [Pseudomonadota bacterium]